MDTENEKKVTKNKTNKKTSESKITQSKIDKTAKEEKKVNTKKNTAKVVAKNANVENDNTEVINKKEKAKDVKISKQENTEKTVKKEVNKKEPKTTKKVKTNIKTMPENENITLVQEEQNLKNKNELTSKKKKEPKIKNSTEDKKEEDNNDNTKKSKSKSKKTKKENEKVNMQTIENTVREELKQRRTILKEELKKMNNAVFKNIFIAIAVVLFLNFIILGFINIEQSVFIVDLKVFSIILLAVAICIIEYAYKKDSGEIAIYGIETLVLAVFMLVLIYLDIMFNSKFVIIAILSTYIFAIYYTVKSIVIYQKMKKQYFINSMKKIIKKEQKETI